MDPFQLIQSNNLESLKYYLSRNSCEIENENKETLLHCSIKSNNMDILLYLLRLNISINKTDIFGNTALMLAVQYNKLGFVKVLLRNKADVNISNLKNETPIFKACSLNREEIAILLLSYKPNLNISNVNNENICFSLVRSANIKLLNLIIKKKIDLNSVLNYNDDNLLHTSVKNDNYEMTHYLLKQGVTLHKKNKDLETPIFLAVRNQNKEIFELLLEYNAFLDNVNAFDETIFNIKVGEMFFKFLKEKEESTLIKYIEYKKRYPLHYYVIKEDMELIRLTINKNHLSIKDNFKYFAIDYARLLNNKDIINYLENYKSKKK